MGRPIRATEISEIIARYKQLVEQEKYPIYESCAKIGEEFGRSQGTIYQLIRRFQPTVIGAEAYIKAQALKLAMRVVRKADAAQAIDILTRSNVGVLAPKQESGGSGGGFFLSVKAENLGAVKIGVMTGQDARLLEAPVGTSPSAPYSGASGRQEIDEIAEETVEVVGNPMREPGVPHPNQGTFGRFSKPEGEWAERHKVAIENARRKLTEARSVTQKRVRAKKRAEVEV